MVTSWYYIFLQVLYILIAHPEIEYIQMILHNVYGFLNILEGAKNLNIFMKYLVFKFPKLDADLQINQKLLVVLESFLISILLPSFLSF